MHGHLVALRGKVTLVRGWDRWPWDGVQLPGQDGVGIIPWSIGCVVVDVDDPDGESIARAALGVPLATQRTPSGGVHLIYRADAAVPNRKWRHGDLRGGSGYVRVYDPAAFDAAAAARYSASAPDLARLPGRIPTPRPAVTRTARRRDLLPCRRGCDGGCWACSGRLRDIPTAPAC